MNDNTKQQIAEAIKGRQMFVRYIGAKICYTTDKGNFVMCDKEVANPEEIAMADSGGGEMPLTFAVLATAS